MCSPGKGDGPELLAQILARMGLQEAFEGR